MVLATVVILCMYNMYACTKYNVYALVPFVEH